MRKAIFLLTTLALLALLAAPTLAASPVVHGVMFYADGCGHCESVIKNTLPPLQAKYGDQLQIAMVEVSAEADYQYFRQIEDQYKVPTELRGVPALFIGDQLLVGDRQIPTELPKLIEKHLTAGGVDYPALPGLAERLGVKASGTGVCAPATPCTDTPAQTPQTLKSVKFSAVPVAAAASGEPAVETAPAAAGFELAWGVMALLALTLLYALVSAALAGSGRLAPAAPAWGWKVIPVLAVIGLGVALYLTYVETQNVAAVCGPAGDCNTVQASPYARLFGILPVGLLGALGYVAILAAWAVWRFTDGELSRLAPVALLGMSLFGVLFSIYLTYLELFVILAVCIWCLGSAVVQALLLGLSVGPAVQMIAGEDETDDEET